MDSTSPTSSITPLHALTADRLQAELVALDDAHRELARGDFVGRHALSVRLDAVRSAVKDHHVLALDEAKSAWADRAGHKGTHAEDPETAQAVARSMMPGEGGIG